MKIAIIGDTHIGKSKGSDIFEQYFAKCFGEFIFPLLKKQGVEEVVQLGDMFDDRKAVSTKSITASKEYLFEPLKEAGLNMTILVGNHDLFYRETFSVISQVEFLAEYDNLEIVTGPTYQVWGDDHTKEYNVGFIPWICKENYEEVLNFIENTDSEILCGHFEIEGFQMYKGIKSQGGLSPKLFKRFESVWSGHYHTKSTVGNISYLGTPYELTWMDCDDPRGIHIFDTETRELEFFENPFNLHHKVMYNEGLEINFTDYKDTFVKVYVMEKASQVEFDKFIQSLYDAGVHKVDIIEDLSEFKETSDIDDDEEINIEDTSDIVNRYIDSIDTDKDKERIKEHMQKLHLEAINLENG